PRSRANAAALLSILGDPEVTRYHSMPTLTTLAEARAALERLQQRRAARDAIRWAIELAGHGQMVGTVELLRFDFEQRRAEVGYEIARPLWGRGVVPEAVAAVIGYGFPPWTFIGSRPECCPRTPRRCGCFRSSDSSKRARGETTCTARGAFAASGG